MVLPAQLLKYLDEGGRPLLKGYLRFLDASDRARFQTLLSDATNGTGGEPFAITAFGDLLVWDGSYVLMHRFVDGRVDVILSGFDFFFANVEDVAYQADYFDLTLFDAARARLGDLAPNECYVFEPAPALGGTRDVAHLGKGKSFEYLSLLRGL